MPIPITVDLIASITSFLKDGEDPVWYICERDTDKKISKQMKECFVL